MAITARYRNGALLSYCLVAYSPWEGLRVAITGTKGRIQMDIEENITHLLGDGQVADAQASKGPFKQARMRVFPMFEQGYEVDVPVGEGGHGGADPVMLEQISQPPHPPTPLTGLLPTSMGLLRFWWVSPPTNPLARVNLSILTIYSRCLP